MGLVQMKAQPSAQQPESPDLGARAVGTGCIVWLVALVVVTLLDSRRLGRVLFPLWEPVSSLGGPGFNMGTAEHPVYEGTPVQMLAAFAGIVLSALFYILVAYVWFRWRYRRSHDQRRDEL
jgi:hypothetical protein